LQLEGRTTARPPFWAVLAKFIYASAETAVFELPVKILTPPLGSVTTISFMAIGEHSPCDLDL